MFANQFFNRCCYLFVFLLLLCFSIKTQEFYTAGYSTDIDTAYHADEETIKKEYQFKQNMMKVVSDQGVLTEIPFHKTQSNPFYYTPGTRKFGSHFVPDYTQTLQLKAINKRTLYLDQSPTK